MIENQEFPAAMPRFSFSSLPASALSWRARRPRLRIRRQGWLKHNAPAAAQMREDLLVAQRWSADCVSERRLQGMRNAEPTGRRADEKHCGTGRVTGREHGELEVAYPIGISPEERGGAKNVGIS